MVEPELFLKSLIKLGVNFFSGVPDSLLKDFINELATSDKNIKHIVTVNEGQAVGLAGGYYLSSGKIPAIYLQNSGLGNAINPLMSFADETVYSIPMLLIIGWRGEPGIQDEPQHIKQGQITEDLLSALKIDYQILSPNSSNWNDCLSGLVQKATSECKPVALLVKKGTFSKSLKTNIDKSTVNGLLSRKEVLEMIISTAPHNAKFITTTGFISREAYLQIKNQGKKLNNLLMVVGSMGHASQIATGVSLGSNKKIVVCIDGDGSLLMHMGSLVTNGELKDDVKVIHIILNNKLHESVGGQKLAGEIDNFSDIAKACGYRALDKQVNTTDVLKKELIKAVKILENDNGIFFIDVRVGPSSGDSLPRPSESMFKLRKYFIES
jgi:phosphonopyruvate decarboxylase